MIYLVQTLVATMIYRTMPRDISMSPRGHSRFREWTHLHQLKIPRLQMILQPLCQDHMGFLKMVQNNSSILIDTKHLIVNANHIILIAQDGKKYLMIQNKGCYTGIPSWFVAHLSCKKGRLHFFSARLQLLHHSYWV